VSVPTTLLPPHALSSPDPTLLPACSHYIQTQVPSESSLWPFWHAQAKHEPWTHSAESRAAPVMVEQLRGLVVAHRCRRHKDEKGRRTRLMWERRTYRTLQSGTRHMRAHQTLRQGTTVSAKACDQYLGLV
jgi:hypothetical protein